MTKKRTHGPAQLPSERAAVLYARVSSKEQEKEGYSIPAQQKLLREYATHNDFRIIQEFTDVETAKEAGRANFGEMMAFLRGSGECQVVLVEKTDRLYRNLKDWVSIDELALEIHFVKENVVLSSDSRSAEKFMHGIKVLMAKNYIDNLSEETQKGMREKAEQGLWPSSAPMGYRNVIGSNGRRVIEPDPRNALHITRLFETYATGNYSLREITRFAHEWGLAYKSGWRLPKSVIHAMMRNPIYMGQFIWAGREYQGIHQPLVTEEHWELVQDTLDNHFGKRQRRITHAYAYSGFITCGHCGYAMVAEKHKGRYVYYHCHTQGCREKYAREEMVEAQLLDLLATIALEDDVLAFVKDALHESHADEKRFHDQAITSLQADYQRLQRRVDTMYLDKLDGRIDGSFYDAKSAEWREEQRKILRDTRRHQEANTDYLDEGLRLLDLAARADKLFRERDHEGRRELLGFVLADSSWKDGKLHGSFRLPFSLIADANARAVELRRAHRPRRIQSSNLPPEEGVVTKVGLNSSEQSISNSKSISKGLSEAEIEIWRPRPDLNRRPPP